LWTTWPDRWQGGVSAEGRPVTVTGNGAGEDPAGFRLDVRELEIRSGSCGPPVVSGVCFAVWPGEVLGLVGESGSGKTTVALALLGHTRRGLSVSGGEIRLDGVDLLRRYPHQLSGGQQQRVGLAMAFACRPSLIVLDEPTTGLDVSTQRHILDTMRSLCRAYGVAAVYGSHDLAVISELVAEVAVMYAGRIVESGPAAMLFRKPLRPYTRAARLRSHAGRRQAAHRVSASHGPVPVLSGIDLEVSARACVAIVGESGSGKTTLARCVTGLHQNWTGDIAFAGAPLARSTRQRPRRVLKGIQYVFQNPYTSLNPRKTVGQIVAEPLQRLLGLPRGERTERVVGVLNDVSLGGGFLSRYPDQLSGGERQRVAIARALVVEPDLLICDEVTSALDVSVQAVIVELLRTVQAERHLAMIFITHNLALVRSVAQSAVVLRQGEVVEAGPVEQVLARPSSRYTAALLADVPRLVAPQPGVGPAG
jgi:peptide/nickel transport system ATP-binding protein